MPDEWERDASMIPYHLTAGRYVFWSWTNRQSEKQVMPFMGSTQDWPGVLNKTEFNMVDSIEPPASMGMLFRDPSTYELFQLGNTPFQNHLRTSGVEPTDKWPAVLYGTLPTAWGLQQDDTNETTLHNLQVMQVLTTSDRQACL
jgi:hypothetical protein